MKTIVEFNNKNRTVKVEQADNYHVFITEEGITRHYIYHDKQTALDVFQYECCREPVRYNQSWGGCPLNRPGVYGI